MFIQPIPKSEAVGAVAEMYETEEAQAGYMPTLVEIFSHHPEAYYAFGGLIGSIRKNMDLRRCELATLAAALSLKGTACSVAHGKVLRDKFYDPGQVVRIARDHRHADLDEVDVAVMDFAERAAQDPNQITSSEVEHLKLLGLSDRDVLDVVLAVSARAFVTILIESLGASPEKELTDDLEPQLLDVLVVGRPLPTR